jgi:glycosyltransferase involved in cell wall biosynthesis
MVIAINTIMKGGTIPYDNEIFIFETFRRIIKLHSSHTFILVSGDKPCELFGYSDNIIHAVTGLNSESPSKLYFRFNIKINAILKKYKADIFVGFGLGSSKPKVPQIIIAPDLSFIHFPQLFKKTHLLFYKSFLPRLLKKSKKIIVFSQYGKDEISKYLKTENGKIDVIKCGINGNFHKISFTERELVKSKFAGSNEYFIYPGEIAPHKNLMNLLKAFSAFKKRQKSSMQLIIAGNPGHNYEDFIEDLRLFKFREDVRVFENVNIEQLVQLTESSYAIVQISNYECFATHVLQAMLCGIPVIASSAGALPEIFEDAALYADQNDYKEIAIKMMMLFRDENLRNELIKKGEIQAAKYNWDTAASMLWKSIENTAM